MNFYQLNPKKVAIKKDKNNKYWAMKGENRSLDKNTPIILYCRSGNRSSMSANKISKLGFKEIYNLEGGILEWINIIDPSLTAY